MMVRSSRVDQPPVSGVPVAGASEGVRLSSHNDQELPTSRVQGIDIDGQIDRVLGADALADFLDDTLGA